MVTITVFIVANCLVVIAYVLIPFALMRSRRSLKRQFPLLIGKPFLMFSMFIFFCGFGHALDVLTVWWPMYHLKAAWDCGTAFFSLYTARMLFLTLPKLKIR